MDVNGLQLIDFDPQTSIGVLCSYRTTWFVDFSKEMFCSRDICSRATCFCPCPTGLCFCLAGASCQILLLRNNVGYRAHAHPRLRASRYQGQQRRFRFFWPRQTSRSWLLEAVGDEGSRKLCCWRRWLRENVHVLWDTSLHGSGNGFPGRSWVCRGLVVSEKRRAKCDCFPNRIITFCRGPTPRRIHPGRTFYFFKCIFTT